jgi:hypothetical protein
MANSIPPIPVKVPVIGKTGLMTQPWLSFFQEMFLRVGGNSAPGTSQVLTLISNLQEEIDAVEVEADGLGQEPVA